jgi:two-component system nitrogen regulation response regulator NtrX
MTDAKQIKILIVDDERDFLETMGFWLKSKGYSVETANGGSEAIQKLPQYQPDVVFLDVVMPGMDGIETLREIRKTHQSLSVIMVTAHTSNKKITEAEELGVAGFFRKSADFSHAAKMIQVCLDKLRDKEGF